MSRGSWMLIIVSIAMVVVADLMVACSTVLAILDGHPWNKVLIMVMVTTIACVITIMVVGAIVDIAKRPIQPPTRIERK